ncbi:MAG: LamG-like jellyroll fold domain-containing protein [Phycisphaerales bacterium JB050]
MQSASQQHPDHRRGTIYIVMLAVLSIVMTISLSTLIDARTDLAASSRGNEEAEARRLARSALELGVDTITTDTAWRESVVGGMLIDTTAIGDGTFRVTAVDPVDGDLLDQYDDPILLLAEGQYGQATQKLACRIEYAATHDRSLEPILSRHALAYWTLRELDDKESEDVRDGEDAKLKGKLTYDLTDPLGIYRMPQLSAVDKTYFEIDHDSSMEIDYGSICFWMRPSSTYSSSSLTQVALSKWKWDEPNATQLAVVCTNGFVYLIIDYGGDMRYVNMGSITGDQWHHIALTWGASGWSAYLDGTPAGNDARKIGLGRAWTSKANQMDWYIGAADDIYRRYGLKTGISNYFHGKICDLALFAYELDEATIKTLANIPPKPVPAILNHDSITRVID